MIDAANGRVVATIKGSAGTKWFAALTDRDPAVGNGCQGGSSARIPFGVLTRTEERYTAGQSLGHWPAGSFGSMRWVLSTVPAVNKADPGMNRARPGHTPLCPPPSVSVPADFHYRKVKETFSVQVPNNEGVGCGRVPKPIRELKELAPALP